MLSRLALLIGSTILYFACFEIGFRYLVKPIYPFGILRTEKPNLDLYCYDENIIGDYDYDLNKEHPFKVIEEYAVGEIVMSYPNLKGPV